MGLKKLIDLDLLDRFLNKVKELIPTKVSELENDSGFMSGMTLLSYGSSTWSDFITAYNEKKVVYCRASSNSNPASGSQTRLAFMAYVNNAATPTEVEFQYYRSVNAHTDAQQGDQVYVYKLNKNNGWSVIVRNAFSKLVTGTGLTNTYSNGTITITNSEIVPGVVSAAADGLAPQLPDESTTTKFLRQDATWAVPEYPVTSVNGSTGAVTVNVPSNTSDLQNDSGFITGITSADVTTALGYTPPRQDTTYESKVAASGGTDVSLVTTGEKYEWNNKGTYSKPSGGIPASDLASGVIPTVPTAYTSNPAMDGTASPGSSGSWAKGDHVHPTDTSRQAKITASGILKGDGSGGVSAAVAGTDYLTPETNYSPVRIISANYSITADDVGKTISADAASGAITITLPSSVDTAAPNGAEIAIMKHDGSGNAVQINLSSISGARYSNGGSPLRVTVAKISSYEMVALKKLGNGFWMLFGNVEVVS